MSSVSDLETDFDIIQAKLNELREFHESLPKYDALRDEISQEARSLIERQYGIVTKMVSQIGYAI